MTKLEKILAVLITGPFVGTLVGLILGALFGGRGGMFFVLLGTISGGLFGIARSVYLYFKFDPALHVVPVSSKRLFLNRSFLVIMYLVAIYTIIVNLFFDLQ